MPEGNQKATAVHLKAINPNDSDATPKTSELKGTELAWHEDKKNAEFRIQLLQPNVSGRGQESTETRYTTLITSHFVENALKHDSIIEERKVQAHNFATGSTVGSLAKNEEPNRLLGPQILRKASELGRNPEAWTVPIEREEEEECKIDLEDPANHKESPYSIAHNEENHDIIDEVQVQDDDIEPNMQAFETQDNTIGLPQQNDNIGANYNPFEPNDDDFLLLLTPSLDNPITVFQNPEDEGRLVSDAETWMNLSWMRFHLLLAVGLVLLFYQTLGGLV